MGAEKGSEEFYKKVLSVRESIPAIKKGKCEYLTITENERVFTPLFRYGKEWALPLISFSQEPVDTWVSLEAIKLDPDKTYTLKEAFSGSERTGTGHQLASLNIHLEPYDVQVWTVKETNNLNR
jgi:hypothetical protein